MFDNIEGLDLLFVVNMHWGHSNGIVAKFPNIHVRFPKKMTYSNISDAHIYMCKSRA